MYALPSHSAKHVYRRVWEVCPSVLEALTRQNGTKKLEIENLIAAH